MPLQPLVDGFLGIILFINATATAAAVPCRIVDCGDDYAHYRMDQRGFAPRNSGAVVKLIKELDLDHDGQKGDSLSYVEFNLNAPITTAPHRGPGFHYDMATMHKDKITGEEFFMIDQLKERNRS